MNMFEYQKEVKFVREKNALWKYISGKNIIDGTEFNVKSLILKEPIKVGTKWSYYDNMDKTTKNCSIVDIAGKITINDEEYDNCVVVREIYEQLIPANIKRTSTGGYVWSGAKEKVTVVIYNFFKPGIGFIAQSSTYIKKGEKIPHYSKVTDFIFLLEDYEFNSDN